LKSTLFILAAFFVQFAEADTLGNCDFNTSQYLKELRDFNEIQGIELKVDEYRKWTQNVLEAFIQREPSITPKYKKRFLANVLVQYSFGKCTHRSKVRLHGDWKDHISFTENGQINQSMDVSLEEGSIANIVKFKLLLPETRNGTNEIVLTKILRLLGMIAPRTSLVPVKINGINSEMLFQEKASKELMEGMSRREGPLFEGDERFLWGMHDFDPEKLLKKNSVEEVSFAKITNDNWASSSYISALIALNSFSTLQKAYITYERKYEPLSFAIDWELISQNNEQLIEKWAMFEMLLFATNSTHGLLPQNRKFYYNSFQSGFEPVYFDGDTLDIGNSLIRRMPRFDEYPHLKSEHFEALYKKIQSLDPKILSSEMQGNLFSLSNQQSEQILKNILFKISRIQEAFHDHRDRNKIKIEDHKDDLLIQQKLINNIKNTWTDAYVINVNALPLEETPNLFGASTCNVFNESCKNYALDISEIGRLLERKKLANQNFNAPLFISPPPIFLSDKRALSFNNGGIKVEATKGSILSFNEKTLTLTIELFGIDDWVLIKESNLHNITVILKPIINSYKPKLSPSRFNHFGLTGCLTFYKSSFENTKVFANGKNSQCEDVVNIVNSSGSIQDIEIRIASADGLDIDFSNLTIANLKVFDALNDCVDFSQGDYDISAGILQNCGDKGISIGERSMFIAKDIAINESHIGIASKDSSDSSIHSIDITNAQICAEAFQKKQEFFGSKLKITNLKCNVKEMTKDINSTIQIL